MRFSSAVLLVQFLVPSLAGAQVPVQGFPVPAGSLKPVITEDLDLDGIPEIIASGEAFSYSVFTANGMAAPGWPHMQGASGPGTPPVAGDLDGDGFAELTYAEYASFPPGRLLWVLDGFGQDELGWPIPVHPSIQMQHKQFSLGDLDGDGVFEMVWPTRGSIAVPLVYVIRGDGTPMPGWPVSITMPPGYESVSRELGALAVGDLDGDGKDEVLVSINTSTSGSGPIPNPIFVFDDDGTHLATWFPPDIHGDILYSLIIADLDADGDQEVVAAGNSRLYWFDGSGGIFAPFLHTPYMSRHRACADVDGNGDLEIVSGGNQVRVIDPEYGVVASFADPEYYWFHNPTVGDLDGDGAQEIAVWGVQQVDPGEIGSDWEILLLDSDLVPEPGWPVHFEPVQGQPDDWASIHARDLDLDGDMELITAYGGGMIHAYQVPNPTGGPISVQWNGMQGDNTNSRFARRGFVPPLRYIRGDSDRDGLVTIGDAIGSLAYQFLGLEQDCPAALDWDADGLVLVGDPIQALGYLFLGSSPPSGPGWPECEPMAPVAIPCDRTVCD